MRKVAVSQRTDDFPQRHETRDALDQKLLAWLWAGDYQGFQVPNSVDSDLVESFLSALNPNAVLLSGGSEELEIDNSRNVSELALISYAKRHNLPILGICRGMQVLLKLVGTDFKQVDGHIATRHKLVVQKSVKNEFPVAVNSFHSMGVNSDTVPEYEIIARSEVDGNIEAIRHKNMPFEGWMWHPERDQTFCIKQLNRLKKIFG